MSRGDARGGTCVYADDCHLFAHWKVVSGSSGRREAHVRFVRIVCSSSGHHPEMRLSKGEAPHWLTDVQLVVFADDTGTVCTAMSLLDADDTGDEPVRPLDLQHCLRRVIQLQAGDGPWGPDPLRRS